MESNTPRTDIFPANWDRYNFPEDAIEHARQLEAELDAAKRALAEMNERNVYDAIADAVREVSEMAADAFRKAGLAPGEWDSDDIVKDVGRGIAHDIDRLSARLEAEHVAYEKLQYRHMQESAGLERDMVALAAKSTEHTVSICSAHQTPVVGCPRCHVSVMAAKSTEQNGK